MEGPIEILKQAERQGKEGGGMDRHSGVVLVLWRRSSPLEIALLVWLPLPLPLVRLAYLDGAAGPARRREQDRARCRACTVAVAARGRGGLLHGLLASAPAFLEYVQGGRRRTKA